MTEHFLWQNFIANSAVVGVLGWFVKRWINGTAHDIDALKKGKVDCSTCALMRGPCEKTLDSIYRRVESMSNCMVELKICVKEHHAQEAARINGRSDQ